jgi:hypothetical protein
MFGWTGTYDDADISAKAKQVSRSILKDSAMRLKAEVLSASLACCFLTGCGQPDDEALKRTAARECGLSPNAITLWKVLRDPKTDRPIAIASSGVPPRCLDEWKARNNIAVAHY